MPQKIAAKGGVDQGWTIEYFGGITEFTLQVQTLMTKYLLAAPSDYQRFAIAATEVS